MKGYCRSWRRSSTRSKVSRASSKSDVSGVVVADRLGLRLADDDQAAVAGAEDLDLNVVEAAQRLGRDDLFGAAGNGPARADVHYFVDEADHRVYVVGDENDADPLLVADA